MLVIGLTGGIGSGKSTVADCFARLGVPIIDADAIARELVEPGMPALRQIAVEFGVDALTTAGHLDRARLRRLVFADAGRRKRLEAILHPLIRREMQRCIKELDAPYCILVIPLLLETGQADLVQRILVVDAPEALRRRRVRARDTLTDAEITAIMDTQLAANQRCAAADDIIVNDADLAGLEEQVEKLHRHYLELAGKTVYRPPPVGENGP